MVADALLFLQMLNTNDMKKIFFLALLAMLMGTQDAAAAKKQKTVRVETAEQFIRALANDTRIVIPEYTVLKLSPVLQDDAKMKELGLTPFDTYAGRFDEFTTPTLGYHDHFDGNELDMAGFKNLTIEGEGEMAGIIVEPRYAYVLAFFNCDDITLRNLTLGHTESGYCEGGVVRLAECRNSRIEGCDLYGCGTEGIGAERSDGIVCENTIIRDCSYQIMTLQHCNNVTFNNCNMYNCREYGLLIVSYCKNVTFNSCDIHDNVGSLFSVFGNPITMNNCKINHPMAQIGDTDMVIDNDCTWQDPGDFDEADHDHDGDCECGDGTEGEDEYTDWDWDEKPLTLPADVKKPTIRDFVIAVCDASRSPLLTTLGASIRMPANNEIDVLEIDVPNGYILAGWGAGNASEGDYRAVECCYWRMNNGHSLLAVNQLHAYPALSIRFYEYDPATHVLTPRPDISPYEGIPDGLFCRHMLPHLGKSIQMVETDNIYHQEATQTWDGEKFVLKLTDEPAKFGGTPKFAGGEFDMISFLKKYYPDEF